MSQENIATLEKRQLGGIHEILQNDPVVAANLAALYSPELSALSGAESYAGNAGSHTTESGVRSAAALNGYADRETGLITCFGNIQSVDPEIVARDGHFTIRKINSPRTLEDRFVSVSQEGDISPDGITKIEQAVAIYNAFGPERVQKLTEEIGEEAVKAFIELLSRNES